MIISFPDKPGKWQNISRTQYEGLLQLLRTLCQRGTYLLPFIFFLHLGQGVAQALNRILIIVRHEEGHYKHTECKELLSLVP